MIGPNTDSDADVFVSQLKKNHIGAIMACTVICIVYCDRHLLLSRDFLVTSLASEEQVLEADVVRFSRILPPETGID